MSPHCVWLVIVGGFEKIEFEEGVTKPTSTLITDTSRLMMIVELGKMIHI